MIEAFKPGVFVKYKIPDGAIVKILRYEKEGWYIVEYEGLEWLAHENDLELYKPFIPEFQDSLGDG
ncbi:hypothetical protein A2Z67_03895 [Candidatus Woesebacteria bacterium RBG_13_36_22]|uniref:Uncharacterized protein n=1 Tax=Candidatus Woesebacteria bacterium RBG_13_36_22 TaxID=1802478 RepID=A0A1F7WZI6_9BACT|nr:MAG: hypothetical protein A2Z67_03895 [Candidatus Woesebacteria bacterium RBG_13_36_22]